MSKVLLLSAGSSDVSGNKKAAEYSKGYLKEKGVETYLFDNLYSDIPVSYTHLTLPTTPYV